MAFPNTKQKIIILDINVGTQIFIEAKLLEGYQIMSITNLNPTFDKLLIVYTLNEVEPIIEP